MFVVGTAGHVDHGKSTLIEALTGIDPDRLKEEKERELTIDLGFAWMDLPSGQEIGFVDVPGHRDFIENMLAGVGAVDAALFVVAADEGVMPQTREHLAILDLLEIERAVVALTKIDAVQEPEWLELVEEEVVLLLSGTRLSGAPIVRVSGRSGEGVESLIDSLDEVLGASQPRPDLARPRLGVDRVFTVAGFGTVVTGTLVDGSLRAGDEIVVLPGGTEGRIRGLQTHKQEREFVEPGSRAAANISGVDVAEIRRGDVVAHPGSYTTTDMLDVYVRLLELGQGYISHDQELKLFLGASQRMVRARVLGGAEQLGAGEEGWLQLLLDEPIVAQRNDRYILRRPSPPLTLGGGLVADPHPGRKHRMKDEAVIERLGALIHGSRADVLGATLAAKGFMRPDDLYQRARVAGEQVKSALEELRAGDRVLELRDDTGEPWLAEVSAVARLREQAAEALSSFHGQYPLRPGMPQEELRSRLNLAEREFQALLAEFESQEILTVGERWVAEANFAPRLNEEQAQAVAEMLDRFRASPYTPPTVKDVQEKLGPEVYEFLRQRGDLVQVSEEVVFARDAYEDMRSQVQRLVAERGPVTVAEVRDHFGASRKYVLALLEHLDRRGVTVRDGDVRRLKAG